MLGYLCILSIHFFKESKDLLCNSKSLARCQFWLCRDIWRLHESPRMCTRFWKTLNSGKCYWPFIFVSAQLYQWVFFRRIWRDFCCNRLSFRAFIWAYFWPTFSFILVNLESTLAKAKNLRGWQFVHYVFCAEGCPRLQKSIGLRPIKRRNTSLYPLLCRWSFNISVLYRKYRGIRF